MPALRIALDVSIQETACVTGVERVQRSLLQALGAIDPEDEFFLLGKKEHDLGLDLPPNFRQVALLKDGSPYLWRERVLGPWLTRERIDVFHSGVSATPILGSCRKVVTLHELPWVEREASKRADYESAPARHRVWLFLNVRYATRLVAVSERTRGQIVELYPDAAPRVAVIRNGVDPRFRRLADPPARAELLARLGIPDGPFLLFVGTLRRKKNLRGLLAAFAQLPESLRESLHLVLAGVKSPSWPDLDELLAEGDLRRRVFTPGYVADTDLVALYNLATAVVYPSLFEGFGLPPLEAMACGAPVIASEGGAIPEVVGDAALLCAPHDPDAWRQAIERVALDAPLRAELVEKGERRAREFGMRGVAEKYLDLYREVAG